MNISDPIADMLTRVRNASRARHTEVVVPASRTKREIARILKDEGFIADVREEQDGPRLVLQLTLKYVDGKVPVVSGLKRISKPGLRVYAAQDRHPARARRPRHRHRQHEPGDHDRRAGPQGPARRRSPGVRLVGRRHVTHRPPAHRRPVERRRDDRRPAAHGQGPQGHPDPRPASRHARRAARTDELARHAGPTEQKTHKQLHGLTRTLVEQHGRRRDRRLPQGPRDHRRRLSRRSKVGEKLQLNLGYSHPIEIDPPEGISFEVENPTRLAVVGIDKELVGQIAAQVRSTRKPEPYKGKGVRYAGEKIRRKAGKAGKIGGKK